MIIEWNDLLIERIKHFTERVREKERMRKRTIERK